MALPDLRRDLLSRFAQHLQIPQHGIKRQLIIEKLLLGEATAVAEHLGAALPNVLKKQGPVATLVLLRQAEGPPCSMRWRNSGRSPRRVTRSPER